MKLAKFIKMKQEEAITALKEESAVIFLLEDVLKCNATTLFNKLNEEISDEDSIKFNSLFDLYLNHNKPIQYLVGYITFYGYDFIVNEDVLIPRFETEELVENILYRYDKYFKGQDLDVIDIGTGSGAIAISLAKEESHLHLTATDISSKALAVAKANANKLDVDITFLEGDMLEPLTKKYDILVSNPPYIPQDENVDSLVKDNEPNIALFGGNDGLKFYRIILENAKKNLKDRAMICFEHAYDKKKEIEELAKLNFPTAKVETIKDLEGKDRMTFIYIGGGFDE